MPVLESIPVGAPCWLDLHTSDPAAARTFYGALLGWTAQDMGAEYGGYVMFSHDGVPVAGMMADDGTQGTPDGWNVYLAVEDARATIQAAAAAGAQVRLPAMDVMELGTTGLLADPGGAAIGLWQPALHQGFGVHGETGTPVHFELHTYAYDASVAFYKDVFAWDAHTMADTPEFRYTTYGEGDDAVAGIMDDAVFGPTGAGAPAAWRIYFGVDDTAATLVQAVELGGSVLEAAVDTPYGRLARVADPTGAGFAVMQPLS